mmetsp:Transcript_100676/g.256208  ORF Transcript_100676/g.256208 Transcript_100676/m.256208 type:complete len:253 (+) Transcript_100676:737-1495(+)
MSTASRAAAMASVILTASICAMLIMCNAWPMRLFLLPLLKDFAMVSASFAGLKAFSMPLPAPEPTSFWMIAMVALATNRLYSTIARLSMAFFTSVSPSLAALRASSGFSNCKQKSNITRQALASMTLQPYSRRHSRISLAFSTAVSKSFCSRWNWAMKLRARDSPSLSLTSWNHSWASSAKLMASSHLPSEAVRPAIVSWQVAALDLSSNSWKIALCSTVVCITASSSNLARLTSFNLFIAKASPCRSFMPW